MTTRKAGLHKDVATIFDSVWNPQIDNIQPIVSPSLPDKIKRVSVRPKPFVTENWSKETKKVVEKRAKTRQRKPFAGRSKREQKRLSSISRNLIINMQN